MKKHSRVFKNRDRILKRHTFDKKTSLNEKKENIYVR